MHSDLIADVLTRIRNAVQASHKFVYVPTNRTIRSILEILKQEGFINEFSEVKNTSTPQVKIDLRYYEGKPVLRGLRRVSKPGRRFYVGRKKIGSTLNHIGVGILTTPKGVLSDKQAEYQRVGGEYLCQVW